MPIRPNAFKDAAAALWDLLDDIDTLDDSCRGDDAAFRAQVRTVQEKREAWAVSPDAQRLVWNVLDWHHFSIFGAHELHYAGEVRARVSKVGPKSAGAEPTYTLCMGNLASFARGDGVKTECDSLAEAMQRAETQVRCDGALPEVPGQPDPFDVAELKDSHPDDLAGTIEKHIALLESMRNDELSDLAASGDAIARRIYGERLKARGGD